MAPLNPQKVRFITEIQKRSAIWDKNNSDHKNLQVLRVCWDEIASLFGISNKIARGKWKNLLDQFRVHIKHLHHGKLSDAGLEDVKEDLKTITWPYFRHMLFVYDIVRPGSKSKSTPPKNDCKEVIDSQELLLSLERPMSNVEIMPVFQMEEPMPECVNSETSLASSSLESRIGFPPPQEQESSSSSDSGVYRRKKSMKRKRDTDDMKTLILDEIQDIRTKLNQNPNVSDSFVGYVGSLMQDVRKSQVLKCQKAVLDVIYSYIEDQSDKAE